MQINNKICVNNLQVREDIIERIKGRDDIKPEIQAALNLDRRTINRLVNENKVNGSLTKMAIVEIIAKRLGVSYDDILKKVEHEKVEQI